MARPGDQPAAQLTYEQRQVVSEASYAVSKKFGDRIRRLAHSPNTLDNYEGLTAVIYVYSSACSLQYVTREKRMDSFVRGHWELLHNTQTAEDMVETGFYCLGDADHVKCFFCDLGLRDWERGDSPELEHAKFSPLCFYLKSSLGLDGLRALTPQTANYPPSYTRQDHNQLLRSIGEEFCSPMGRVACGVGLDDTKVMLSVARNFIRFRKRWTTQELVSNAQAEWEREVMNDPNNPPQFVGQFKLAPVLREFYRIILAMGS